MIADFARMEDIVTLTHTDPGTGLGQGNATNMDESLDLSAESRESLEVQIIELHGMVQEMKDGFVLAMQELCRIQNGDHLLQQSMETHKNDIDTKVQHLTSMLESLQGRLGETVGEVTKHQQLTLNLSLKLDEIQQQQESLKCQVQQKADEDMKQSAKQAASLPTSHSDEGDFPGSRDPLPPMLKPFIDSLPGAHQPADQQEISDSDDDDSTRQASDDVIKLSKKFAEDYHRHRAKLSSTSMDRREHLLFNKQIAVQGELNSAQSGQVNDNKIKKDKRQDILEALLWSERIYVSKLRFIQEGLVQPMVVESIVPLTDIHVMFPPILGQLYQDHMRFLETLETRLSDWKWKGITGDVLAKLSGSDGTNLLELYSSHVASFPDSLTTLAHHLTASRIFYQFIERQLEEKNQGKVDPMVYLMAPLQRISYYLRCMKRLYKHTEKEHPDRIHIGSCLKRLTGFVNEINLITSRNQPSPTLKEVYRRERRNSKASFSSQGSMDTNLRDSGFQSIEGDHRARSTSPTTLATNKDVWTTRPLPPKHKTRHRSLTSDPPVIHEPSNNNSHVTMTFPPHPTSSRDKFEASHQNANTQLVTKYPENSEIPVPGMLGKGSNTAVYSAHDGRHPDDVIDTTRQRRKSRARRTSLSKQQSFGVFGDDDTDIEHVGYVPSTPAISLTRSKQITNSRLRQRRKSIDGMVHFDVSERPTFAHTAMLNGQSNLVTFRSSESVPTMEGMHMWQSASLSEIPKYGSLHNRDVVMPLPQHLRSGSNSRLYTRRRSIDVGALQAHIIREERRAEAPARTRKKSCSPRSTSPDTKASTRRKSPASRTPVKEEPQIPAGEGLSEREADVITEQVFVRTCNLPEDEDPKDTRNRKTTLKHSLKNIFKRRVPGSRVVELTDGSSKPVTSNNSLNVTPSATNDLPRRRNTSPSPSPSLPQRSRSPFLRSRPADLECYVDTDGEPCSAV